MGIARIWRKTSAMGNKACHNCRRRRLRCDQSTPSCRKCTNAGEECLGYGQLIAWNEGTASRGKMRGKTYEMPAQALAPAHSPRPKPRRYRFVPCGNSSIASSASIKKISISPSLCDPLFQDLSHTSRYYVSHCKYSPPPNSLVAGSRKHP